MISIKGFGLADPVIEIHNTGVVECTIEVLDLRAAMQLLHFVARSVRLKVSYPGISDEVIDFISYEDVNMDIAAQVALLEAQAINEDNKDDIKQMFVCPSADKAPDDGILSYVTMESIYDIRSFDAGSVVMVSPDLIEALSLVVSNVMLFKARLIVLTGVPGCEYTPDFDRATWSCEKASYAAIVSEINDARSVKRTVEDEAATKHQRERKAFTRSDGSIKGHHAEVVSPDVEENSQLED